MRTFQILFNLCLCFLVCGVAAAQDPDDVEGGKDTPYFTRMPNFFIDATTDREFDSYIFFDGTKEVAIEGKVYQTRYALKEGAPQTSILQIRRNYLNAIKKMGAKILFEGQHEEFEDPRSGSVVVTALLVKGKSEAWIEVWPETDGVYLLTIVERQAMKQEVTATDMLDALEKDGYVALDIHFDTGKSTIKPESQPILDQIVELMKAHPELNLSIEGHTDNAGDARSNKALSEARATSVQSALVKAGVKASRLSAAGYGQERPVADNRTEEGRAKNRRVELVKK
jgi:outer membrane protein OmpA-like peptidoglycan-associated protein